MREQLTALEADAEVRAKRAMALRPFSACQLNIEFDADFIFDLYRAAGNFDWFHTELRLLEA
jgi:hypothetical protein